MERLWIFILFIVMLPSGLMAQQRTEYNKKGDEAMKRLDYSDARMWYEEGVAECDPYSIDQLTKIWESNKKMRTYMRSLMTKCLNCLTVRANENDSTAVSQLILYYTDGIGTPPNEELAAYWNERLDALRNPVKYTAPDKERAPREPMKLFLGYAYSIEAPYGLTVGGVWERLGWYARVRTNMSFDKSLVECQGNNKLVNQPENESYEFTNRKKTNALLVSAGLVVKCTPWLYTSVGLGYGKRELLCEYKTWSWDDMNKQTMAWAKNTDHSYEGAVVDLDFMVKMGPVFVSAGCNTVNFKYVDLNAGVGVFF